MLVTGASGYVGSRVARALRQAGADVHLSARSTSPSWAHGLPWHPCDLLAPDDAARLIDVVRPSLIVHTAWDVTPGVYWTSPDNARWQAATAELSAAFFEAGGQRFVGIGTCAEYDWSAGVCDEQTTPIAPATAYGQAKAGAWEAIRRAIEMAPAAGIGTGASSTGDERARGRSAAWARIFFPFGGADEHPSRLVPSVVQAIRRGEPALCSPGDQRRDFLHVDEVASAIAALALSEVSGPVNIGSGEARTVRDVVEGLAALLGRPDLIRLGARPADPVPLVAARVERLTHEVRWQPRWTFEAALDLAISAAPAPSGRPSA